MEHIRVKDVHLLDLLIAFPSCKPPVRRSGGSDLEALEGVPSSCRLHLRFKLNKCNVVPSRHQSNLLESRKLVEKHAEHHFIGLLRQVGEEEDLVRWRIVHVATTSMTSTSSSLVKATSCSCREAASSSSGCSCCSCLGFL